MQTPPSASALSAAVETAAESAAAPARKPLRSTLVSRNVTIAGHRTSVRLEPEMWSGLTEICRREGGTLHEICTAVAKRKSENTSLTAAIRVFVMAYYRAASTEEGHLKTGHGYGVAALIAGLSGNRPATAPTATNAAPMPPQMRGVPASPYGNRAFMTNGVTRNGYR